MPLLPALDHGYKLDSDLEYLEDSLYEIYQRNIRSTPAVRHRGSRGRPSRGHGGIAKQCPDKRRCQGALVTRWMWRSKGGTSHC